MYIHVKENIIINHVGTRFDNKTQIVKLITKIESILLQTKKTKRVANQNNKILKNMALQTQYMFDTI